MTIMGLFRYCPVFRNLWSPLLTWTYEICVRGVGLLIEQHQFAYNNSGVEIGY